MAWIRVARGGGLERSKLLKNGRTAYRAGGFSRIPTDMQQSLAYRSLTASALKVLIWSLFKAYKAGSLEKTSCSPTFKFTNAEAKDVLGMNQTTFSRAKQELANKGFLDWVTRGGLKGVNGVASEFSLSGRWKTFDSTLLPVREKKALPPGKNLKSVKAA